MSLFQAEERQFATLRDILDTSLGSRGLTDDVLSVVLFGSIARGDARPDSDVDLLVIVRQEGAIDAVRDALLEADQALREILGVRGSPYVLAHERLKARIDAGDPLIAAVRSEGRTVMGAPFDQMLDSW